MTEYIVFQAIHPNPEHWEEVARPIARSARAAVNEALNEQHKNDGGGLFVAVPARSFRPVTVKVETKTALKFS